MLSESGSASQMQDPPHHTKDVFDPKSGRGSSSGRVQNYSEPLIIEDIEDDDSDSVAESATRHVYACRGSPPTKVAPCDRCPCLDQDQGRIPTPNLNLSDSRHHLDRTTPDSGILIPPTQSHPSPPVPLSPSPKSRRDVRSSVPNRPPPVPLSPSPNSRRDVRSSVPNRPPPDDGVICRRSRSPSAGAKVQQSVPPSCSSPRCHSIPRDSRVSADISADKPMPTNPVRRLNFERHVRSKSTTPPKRSRSNPTPLSCKSCGTCLQPTVPVPSASSAFIARNSNSRPNVEIVKSAMLDSQPHLQPHPQPTRTASQQKIKQDLRDHAADKPRMGLGVTYNPTADRAGSSGRPGSAQQRSTYKVRDIDELSLSSSCSVASEILERAKHRRKHFWSSQYHQPHE